MAGLFVLSTNTVSAKANLIPSNMSSTLATATVMLQEEAAAASEDRGFESLPLCQAGLK
jgi:biopolymer transport protein ExbB